MGQLHVGMYTAQHLVIHTAELVYVRCDDNTSMAPVSTQQCMS